MYLNTVCHFQRVDALMYGYIFYAWLRKYTKDVMSNYISKDYVKEKKPSIHCSMACPRHRGSLSQEISVSLYGTIFLYLPA